MAIEEIYLVTGFVFLILAFILSSLNSWASGPSHRGATEPSNLPPPPERPFIGPWYMKIMEHDGCAPAKFIKADLIHNVEYDYDGNVWLTMSNGEVKRYANVYEFAMVPIRALSDYCWEEPEMKALREEEEAQRKAQEEAKRIQAVNEKMYMQTYEPEE